MSDVLIKGMEMPKNCGECRFNTDEGFCKAKSWNFCGYTDDDTRADWCPLVKVPTIDGDDIEFLTKLISIICNYAIKNGYEPNETLKTTAEDILALLEISNFNEWKGDAE